MYILGIDLGTNYCGFSLVSSFSHRSRTEISKNNNKPQVLYAERLWLRSDKNFPIVDEMRARRRYRRTRRSKKKHRKPRFDNRPRIKCKVCGRNTPKRKDGSRKLLCRKCEAMGHHTFADFKHELAWLPPSLKSKAESTIKTVEKISKRFPIDKVKVELVNFDFQKIKNPNIEPSEYQKGYNLGFKNRRAYVIERDKRICKVCGGKKCGNKHLTVHHILGRAEGGGDQPENLICISRECHQKVHQDPKLYEQIKGKFQGKLNSFKFGTQVSAYKSVVLNYLREKFPRVETTYGYITQAKREKMNLKKNHINDAIAIACDFGDKPVLPEKVVISRCIPKGTYQLYKSNPSKGHIFRKHQVNRCLVNKKGVKFQRYDKVKGKVAGREVEGFIGALLSNKGVKIVDIAGRILEPWVSINKLQLLERRKTIISSSYVLPSLEESVGQLP